MFCWPLLQIELQLLKKRIGRKIIDAAIWTCSTIAVSAFVLPALGVPESFGVFQAAGILASIVSMDLYSNIFELLTDIEYTGHLQYLLTLPYSSFGIIATKVLIFALHGLISAVVVFSIICVILLNLMNFAGICFWKLILGTLISSLFFGWFSVFLTQRLRNTAELRSTQVRILFPLWYFGGFSFSWKIMFFKVSKFLGLLCLLNPYMYATEISRCAILGAQDFLPFWVSASALMLLTVLTAYFGFNGLKKRMDCA